MQKKYKAIFKSIILIVTFFTISGVNAQQTFLKRENFLKDFVFKGNHILFDFSTLSTWKARLKKETGSYPVSTKNALGLLLSFKYKINFYNEFSLITGPEIVITGRNIITSFNKNDFSPPLIKDYLANKKNSYYPDPSLSIPVFFEKRWPYNNTRYLLVNTGLRLNFSLEADFFTTHLFVQNTNGDIIEAGRIDVIANNDAKPWVSIPINAGHGWLLKNNNIIELTLCSNISFSKYVNGTYEINVPNQLQTTGRYSSTGSYFGLSFHYIFTSANYRIRKAYEKAKQGK